MSWSRALILAVALAATGCGFHPLYQSGSTGPVAEDMATVEIELIKDRVGQLLRNQLMQSITPLGQPAIPRYSLEVTLTESTSELAVQKTELATRANFYLTGTFILRDATTKASLFSDSQRVVSSYDIIVSDFATTIAEQDARRRAVEVLSRSIVTRLGVYFADARHTDVARP